MRWIMEKKTIILGIIGILLVICIGGGIYKFLDRKDSIKEELVVVGIVVFVDDNFIMIEDIDTKTHYSVSGNNNSSEVGDVVEIYSTQPVLETYPAQVIASRIVIRTKMVEITPLPEVQVPSTQTPSDNSEGNTSENNSSNNHPNSSEENTENNSNSDNISTFSKGSEADVVTFVNALNNDLDSGNISQSAGAKIKANFVVLVDFLFYDGKIKGWTFGELGNKVKLEVLKIALTIDNKIDKVFPGYKEAIASTTGKIYSNVKAKTVELYLNITTKVCANNPIVCQQAKDDLAQMKQSFGLTWETLKELAGNGITKLSEWYLIWREI